MSATVKDSLKFEGEFDGRLLDSAPLSILGSGVDRVDGPLKVTGRATYSAEYQMDDLLYGWLVVSSIAKGTVVSLEDSDARAVPGVVDVITDEQFVRYCQQPGQRGEPRDPHTEIVYAGQPVAIVVAESLEAAREAANLVRPVYHEEPALLQFDLRLDQAERPPDSDTTPALFEQGDLNAAMHEAEFTIDVVYTTPSQHAVAMEPHASIAEWSGDQLTVHSALQMLDTDIEQLAEALDIDQAQVRIVSRYVGGGFGSKLFVSPELVASAIAARKLDRPVKTALTRQQAILSTVRRSNTQQRMRLGASADGMLIAIGHDSIVTNQPDHDFYEPCGVSTHFLYAGKNRRISHDVVRMNWLVTGSMRAPGEGAGMLALECAMDEMAEELGLDPIEFRKRNEPDADPEKEIPFSSRRLIACMDEGAQRFGWSERNRRPGQMREGNWLIGHGMAAASRTNVHDESETRVTLTPELRAIVETDMTDIGTGTYTILAQVAAELLGLPVTSVEVRLGDTDFPTGAGSGGSKAASSGGSSTYVACEAIRAELCKRIGCAPDELRLDNGVAHVAGRKLPIEEYIGDGIEALGSVEPGANDEEYTQAGYGAHFVEVAVDADTGEVRVRRMLGVFAAGRILNEKTARSQCIGGMIFGIGAALTEEIAHDPRTGKIVNHDLVHYHTPAHADVPALDVVFLEERDRYANPLQAKGIGELGISGAGAAIANAVYNATGVRVRDYPLTLDKIIAGLPS